MALDYGPVHARLDRANRHVTDLRTLVDDYSARAYTREVTAVPDRPGRVVMRAELVEQLPVEAAMIVSDAVHQARASLDNLVSVLRGGTAPGTWFPISKSPDDFDMVGVKGLGGVPDWAADVIRRMQPWSMDPRAYVGDGLVTLHNLSRLDRHRAPPLQVALLRPRYVTHDGAAVEMRSNWRSWAEVEYDESKIGSVVFALEVRFAPDVPEAGNFEVVGLTDSLVRCAWAVLEVMGRRGR